MPFLDQDLEERLRLLDEVVTQAAWTTLVNAIRLDDAPTEYNSANMDIDSYKGVSVLISIDSTLAPTGVQFIPQVSDDGGTTYWDYLVGYWASMFFEDADTAAGILRSFDLPIGGFDSWRMRVVATGTDATNYFDVSVLARAYR